jgi:hypothetical protein
MDYLRPIVDASIEHIPNKQRKLYGGIHMIKRLGPSDTYGQNGSITPKQNLANFIENAVNKFNEEENKKRMKEQEENRKEIRDGTYNSTLYTKTPDIDKEDFCYHKYGWNQTTVDITEFKGTCVAYSFEKEEHLVQNPILVFQSDELKNIVNELFSINENIYENMYDFIYEFIDCIELQIGGQRIERIFGQTIKFMQILYNLDYYFERNNELLRKEGKFYLPLPIDCIVNQPMQLASLMYHPVNIYIKLNWDKFGISKDKCKAQLKYDSIYVSKKICRILATTPIEFMIKQVQYTGQEVLKNNTEIQKFSLNFYHPSMGILLYLTTRTSNNTFVNDNEIFEKVTMYYNDTPLFEGDSDYMRYEGLVQLGCYSNVNNNKFNGFYWLPFIRKEDFTCDTSFRTYTGYNFAVNGGECINIKLNKSFVSRMNPDFNYNIHICTINYHPLRIMSGMAGLALSK